VRPEKPPIPLPPGFTGGEAVGGSLGVTAFGGDAVDGLEGALGGDGVFAVEVGAGLEESLGIGGGIGGRGTGI